MTADETEEPTVRRAESRFFDDDLPGLDRFGALLVLTILSVAMLSLIDLDAIQNELVGGLASFVLSTTTGVTLVLALRAAGVARRPRRVAEWLVGAAVAVTIAGLVIELGADRDILAFSVRPSVLWVLIALATPVAVVHRLLRHRRVTVQTLAGAVAAYLLIAIAACYLFLFVDIGLDDGFFGTGDAETNDFMYFSLVTITTLGYGDLNPAEPVSRLAATSLALVGQVYLVTIVAMVVGVFIAQRGND